jgi:hypothetical protein
VDRVALHASTLTNTSNLPHPQKYVTQWLQKCTITSVLGHHPLRTVLFLALNGLVYYRERIVHFDSFNSAYALVMKAGGSHRLCRRRADNFLCSGHHALPQVQVILSWKPDPRISHMRTSSSRLQCRCIPAVPRRTDRTVVMQDDRQEKHPEHPRSRNLEDVAKERESLSLQL